MTSDFASSGPLLIADSLGDLSPPLPRGVPLHNSPAVRVLLSSASPHLPPPAHFRHCAPQYAELGAHPPNPRAHRKTSLLSAQPSPASGSPRAVSPVVRAELGAVCCVLAAGVADKEAAATPRTGRAALGTRRSAASARLQLPAWRYASSGCRRDHCLTHPGTSYGHSIV